MFPLYRLATAAALALAALAVSIRMRLDLWGEALALRIYRSDFWRPCFPMSASFLDMQLFPDLAQFQSYIAAKNPGSQWEIIKQSLYDSAVFPAAGTVLLNLFQSPIGGANSSSSGNATNAKV